MDSPEVLSTQYLCEGRAEKAAALFGARKQSTGCAFSRTARGTIRKKPGFAVKNACILRKDGLH